MQCLVPPALSGGGSGLRLDERALILPRDGSMGDDAHAEIVWQISRDEILFEVQVPQVKLVEGLGEDVCGMAKIGGQCGGALMTARHFRLQFVRNSLSITCISWLGGLC